MTTIVLVMVLSPLQLPATATGLFRHLAEARLEALLKEARLEDLLNEWEKATENIRAAHYVIDWTHEGRVLKDKEIFQIEGFIGRSNLARIDFKDENGKPTQIFLLVNGRILETYNFARQDKTLWEIPVGFPEKYLDGCWWEVFLAGIFQNARELFCFEFAVADIQQQFDTRLIREDKYWAYIHLTPKTKQRQSILRNMEVVLDQKTHLVRQYRVIDVNGNRDIYDFQKLEVNPTPPITLESISKDLPKSFKELQMNKELQINP